MLFRACQAFFYIFFSLMKSHTYTSRSFSRKVVEAFTIPSVSSLSLQSSARLFRLSFQRASFSSLSEKKRIVFRLIFLSLKIINHFKILRLSTSAQANFINRIKYLHHMPLFQTETACGGIFIYGNGMTSERI